MRIDGVTALQDACFAVIIIANISLEHYVQVLKGKMSAHEEVKEDHV